MLNRWSWIALGCGFYLAFALRSLPAAVALPWLAPPDVQIVGAQGTVWRGSAALVSANGLVLRDATWRVYGWPLLKLRVVTDAHASLSEGQVRARLAATSRAVELSGLQIDTSLAALAPVLPRDARNARGLLRAELGKVRFEDGWPTEVAGELRLTQLMAPAITLTGGSAQLVPLGDYAVTFTTGTAAGAVSAQFRDTGGPLEVSGMVSLDRERGYELTGTIQTRAGAPQALVDGVAFIAPDVDAAGKRRFRFSGPL